MEVIALDIPERGPSGANTINVPTSFKLAAKSLIPLALTPSSFVIKITGLSVIILAFLN
jgi:hypothetical protein